MHVSDGESVGNTGNTKVKAPTMKALEEQVVAFMEETDEKEFCGLPIVNQKMTTLAHNIYQ